MSEYIVTIRNKKKEVILSENSEIFIDGVTYNFELTSLNGSTYMLRLNDKVYQLTAQKINGDIFSVYLDGKNYETIVRTSLQEKAIKILEQSVAGTSHKTEVKAPMPGMIMKIKKSVGDEVSLGDSVIILEAMKMENDLRSPASGIIKSISVKEGSAVEKGVILFVLE